MLTGLSQLLGPPAGIPTGIEAGCEEYLFWLAGDTWPAKRRCWLFGHCCHPAVAGVSGAQRTGRGRAGEALSGSAPAQQAQDSHCASPGLAVRRSSPRAEQGAHRCISRCTLLGRKATVGSYMVRFTTFLAVPNPIFH